MPFYKLYSPPEQLSGLIREFQVYHASWHKEKDLPAPFITCLANTEQNLYFYVNDPIRLVTPLNRQISVPPVVLTGPKYKTAGLLFGKDHLMIKIAFHPTGTYRLLGIPMQQTVNTGLDATAFWGEQVNDVLKQLRRACNYDEMIDIVSRFITENFDQSCRPIEPIDEVAVRMLDPLMNLTVEECAATACLSVRQFERNFTTRVGISPKLFIRIVRFEYAMKLKNRCPEKCWSDIALECTYTDSSHLLREFKAFAEFPPSRFYQQPTSGFSDFPTG